MDCSSDSVESSRSVATPNGKIGIIAAVAAAAVAGGPATTAADGVGGGGGPVIACGDGVVLSGFCNKSKKNECKTTHTHKIIKIQLTIFD